MKPQLTPLNIDGGSAPFMAMSFLALTVIPGLRITDRGLVDVTRFERIPLSA